MKYQIKRGESTLIETDIQGRLVLNALGENLINATFSSPESIELIKGDTLYFEGYGTYYLESFRENKNSTNNYDYTAVFQASAFKAVDTAVLDYNETLNVYSPTFALDANADTVVQLCIDQLKRAHPTHNWRKGTIMTTDISHFDIDNENVMSLLTRLASFYETSFNIIDDAIYFGALENKNTSILEYGRFKGLTKIAKRTNEDSKLVNVLYATGSDENLPSWYTKGSRLMLDSPLINQGSINKYGRIEGFFRDESVKPEGRFSVSSVINFSSIRANLGFDVNAHLINNRQPSINFTTGLLAGMSFKFSYEYSSNTILIIGATDRQGVFLPNGGITPMVGDEFNITDIVQPVIYVTNAENILRIRARKYLDNLILNNSKIELIMDPLFSPAQEIKINDIITVKDDNLNINGTFYVTGFDIDLQSFNVKFLRISNKNKVLSRDLSAAIVTGRVDVFKDYIPEIVSNINVIESTIQPMPGEISELGYKTGFVKHEEDKYNIVDYLNIIDGGIKSGDNIELPVVGVTNDFDLRKDGTMVSAKPFIFSRNQSEGNYIILNDGALRKYSASGEILNEF